MLINDGLLKIADFGLSKMYPRNLQHILDQTKRVGSPLYMSPQVLNDQKYTDKCDVWALGISFYEMLFCKTPWDDYNPQSEQDLRIIYKTKPFKYPIEKGNMLEQTKLIIDLLEKMIKYEEADRISWPDIFEHPLICTKKKLGISLIDASNVKGALINKNLKITGLVDFVNKEEEKSSKINKSKIKIIHESEIESSFSSSVISVPKKILCINDEINGESVAVNSFLDKGSSQKIEIIGEVNLTEEDIGEINKKYEEAELKVKFQKVTKHIQSAIRITEFINESMIKVQIQLRDLADTNEILFMNLLFVLSKLGYIKSTELNHLCESSIETNKFYVDQWDEYMKSPNFKAVWNIIQSNHINFEDIFRSILVTVIKQNSLSKTIDNASHNFAQKSTKNLPNSTNEPNKAFNDKLIYDNDFNNLYSDTMLSVLDILHTKFKDPENRNSRPFLILVDYLLKLYRNIRLFIKI